MKSELILFTQLMAALFLFATILTAAEVTVAAPDSQGLRFALGKLESTFSRASLTPAVGKDIEIAKTPPAPTNSP